MSIQRLLIVDTDMTQQAVEEIRQIKKDNVVMATMSFSDLSECCGTMRGLVANGGAFTFVGVMTHGDNMASSEHTLLDKRFITGLQSLFPSSQYRENTCALDLFACDLDKTSPVVRLYSHELDVPIYFSTTITGSVPADWLLEGRAERGTYTQCVKPRDVSDQYLVAEKAARFSFTMAAATAPSGLQICPDFDERFTLIDGRTKAVKWPKPGFNCRV